MCDVVFTMHRSKQHGFSSIPTTSTPMKENSWYPEEREDVSQRTTSPQEQQQGALDAHSPWQQQQQRNNTSSSSPNIWSPSHSSAQEQSTLYSGDSSLHRSTNDSFENDVVTSMASLSFQQPLPQQQRSSSLQAAAAHHGGVPASSSSLTSGSTIPGLTGVSSGSMSGVDSRRFPQSSSLQSAAAASHVGPPPGFISPIQSRNRARSNDSSSSYNSQQEQYNNNRRTYRRGGRGKSGDSSQHSGYSSNSSTRGGSSFHRQQPQQRSNDSSSHATTATSEALRALMNPPAYSSSSISTLEPTTHDRPILPKQSLTSSMEDYLYYDDTEDDDDISFEESGILPPSSSNVSSKDNSSPKTKKHDWLLRMNRRLQEVPVGELDPTTVPLAAVMNAWAKTKSAQGASMVEMWLNRAQQEYDAGNHKIVPTAKLYTMAGMYIIVFILISTDTEMNMDWNLTLLFLCACLQSMLGRKVGKGVLRQHVPKPFCNT